MNTIQKYWGYWVRAVWAASKVFAWIAATVMLLDIAVILRESIGRYVFNVPTQYGYSLVGVSVVVVLYFGLAYTSAVDGHVGSDLLFDWFPPRFQSFVLLIGDAIAAVIGWILGEQSITYASRAISTGAVIPELFHVPLAIPVSFVIVGSYALVIVSVTKMPNRIASMIAGTRNVSASITRVDGI